jgi:hypothetical protein
MANMRLSPSRVSDFTNCPQLYKYRSIDKLPEPPSIDAERGTLVHTVLHDLFESPAELRNLDTAVELLPSRWQAQLAAKPDLAPLISNEKEWIDRANALLATYFKLEKPETFEPTLNDQVVYIGKNKITDELNIPGFGSVSVGKLLLSPTRTYAPLVKAILTEHFHVVKGMIHCSGGGQTKCMKYLPGNMRIVKDNLMEPPPIFKLIQENSGANTKEMYQVFNMGHRLEIFTDAASATALIEIAKTFDIEAQVIGRVEAADQKELILEGSFGKEVFPY